MAACRALRKAWGKLDESLSKRLERNAPTIYGMLGKRVRLELQIELIWAGSGRDPGRDPGRASNC